MRLHLLRQTPTRDQLQEMLEAQGSYIKLAVDVPQAVVVGGGEYHADCEEVLIERGSQQEDIWGADWYPESRTVTFGALVNIRPRQGNGRWRFRIRPCGQGSSASCGPCLRGQRVDERCLGSSGAVSAGWTRPPAGQHCVESSADEPLAPDGPGS